MAPAMVTKLTAPIVTADAPLFLVLPLVVVPVELAITALAVLATLGMLLPSVMAVTLVEVELKLLCARATSLLSRSYTTYALRRKVSPSR